MVIDQKTQMWSYYHKKCYERNFTEYIYGIIFFKIDRVVDLHHICLLQIVVSEINS